MNRFFLILIVLACTAISCSSDDDGGSINPDSFDREGMLANWADNIIVPAFENFYASTQNLQEKTNSFTQTPNPETLAELREAYETAYLDFQSVSMFQIGKAMELDYRKFLNTYPTDATNIDGKIQEGNYDLESTSSYAEQGFPALDYLINGLGTTDAEIAAKYTDENYQNYLTEVATRINALTKEVHDSWKGDYRDTFVNNTSSSSTGSIPVFTNDYINYYEKYIRSGKIGFPAGSQTGSPSPINVEAYYSEDLSRALYIKAVQGVEDFFNGKHFGTSDKGLSYKQYIEYMQANMEGENLATALNAQFAVVLDHAQNLDPNLRNQVETDNSAMLQAYEELQKIVVLLKVDMLQVLYIGVDYVDPDGD